MPLLDRRKGSDRRRDARYHASTTVEWETPDAKGTGKLSDISRTGCFVLAASEVEDGDDVRINLSTPGGPLVFTGKVVNSVFEVGFAVRFTSLSAVQEQTLRGLVEEAAG